MGKLHRDKNSVSNEKTAFTLAEVLITLAIIGVVAAMTLPSVIGHYRKVETSSRLKKFVSTMEQAIRFGEMEHGDSIEWTKAAIQYDASGDLDYDAQGRVSKEFFMTYLAPYFKYSSIEEGGYKVGSSLTTVYLADSSTFAINNGVCIDIRFDTNGLKKPNSPGKDIFAFLMCFAKYYRNYYCGNDKKAFCSYGTEKNINNTREDALAKCKNNGVMCSSLLEMDNWEFKDDYPYKL